MARRLFLALLVAGLAFGTVLLLRLLEGPPKGVTAGQFVPDTVRTRKPYKPVPVRPNIQPTKVVEHAKPDTALRRKAEEGPIIVGVVVKPEELCVSTIDLQGIVHTATFELPRHDAITIGGDGQVEVKPARRKRWKRVLAVAGGVAAVGLTVWLIAK